MEKNTNVNLEELISKAAHAGADVAIKKYKDMEYKEKRRKAFHNTDLLLKKFDILIEHCNNARYTPEDIEIEIDRRVYAEMDEDDIYIKSILKTKTRTQIMINMINNSITSLKKDLEVRDQLYKYKAVDMIYFKKMSFEDASIELSCDQSTIRRWKNDMVRELSVHLYGADGLNIDL